MKASGIKKTAKPTHLDYLADIIFTHFVGNSLVDFLIVDNGCFHHQHPGQYTSYLNKIIGLLDIDGYVVLSTFAYEFIDVNNRLHRYFSDQELQQLLSEADFEIVSEFDIYRSVKKDYYRYSFCQASS